MIKQLQFTNNYLPQKSCNDISTYVSLRYDTNTKTLTLVDSFRGEKNIIELGKVSDGNNKTDEELIEQIKNLDLSSFALKSELPDLSNYALKSEIPSIPDLSNFATKDQIPNVSNFITSSDLPDTSNFATKNEIPDLSNYALKSQIPTIPQQQDLSNYATKDQIPDISNFATKDEIPSLENYALKSEIPTIPEQPDLSIYATKDQIPDVSNFITGYTDEEFKNKITNLISTDINFKNYLIQTIVPSPEPPYIPSAIIPTISDLFEEGEYETLLNTPLTFKSNGNNTINLYIANYNNYWNTSLFTKRNFFISKNGGEWQAYNLPNGMTTCNGANISLTDGETLAISSDISGFNFMSAAFIQFGNESHHTNGGGTLDVYGNILSLTNYDETFTPYMFYKLFKDVSISNAQNLILPTNTLSQECYNNMFNSCDSLTKAPKILPATTLAEGCYRSMFEGCNNLTKASVLPAEILTNECYRNMFKGCSRLSNTPALPSINLATGCYYCMFQNCTSISIAPYLPATTLAQSCYEGIFYGCTSLSYIAVNFSDWLEDPGATGNWLYNVYSQGTFVKPSSLGIIRNIHHIPAGWETQNLIN